MRIQSQTRCAQTVSLDSHNAVFGEPRISKIPANARKIQIFLSWLLISVTFVLNDLTKLRISYLVRSK